MQYGLLVLPILIITSMDAHADSGSNHKGDPLQTIAEVPKRVRDLIEQVESDRDCCEAMSQLADLGPEAVAAVPSLAKMLKHENWTYRAHAGVALYCIGPGARMATAELVEALGDKQVEVHAAASLALSKIGAPAVPGVARALNNPSRFTRRRAALTLGSMGAIAKPALPALKRALSDNEEDVRDRARDAIREIETQSRGNSSPKE